LGGDIETTALPVGADPVNNVINMDLVLSASRFITTRRLHSVEINGLISEGGSGFGLDKTGVATLTLGNENNSFGGQVWVRGGTLAITSLTNTGVNSSIGTHGVLRLGQTGGTGTLLYTGSGDSSNRQITIGNGNASDHTGGSTITNDGTGALIFTNPDFNVQNTTGSAAQTRVLTLNGSNADNNEIQGIIRDNTALKIVAVTKGGPGVWTLSGNNTYTGGTTLNGGLLNIGHANALGTGPITVTSNSRIDNVTGGALTINHDLTLGGNLTFDGTDDLTINGTVELTGNRTVVVEEGGVLTLTGPVGQTTGGDRNLTKGNSGTLRLLSGASSFSGQMQLNNGTVVVTVLADSGSPSSIGTGSGSPIIRIGNQNNSGTLEYVGTGSTTNRQIQIGFGVNTGHNADGVILNNGSGALVFTASAFNVSDAGANNAGNRFLVLGGSNTDDNEIQGSIIDNNAPVSLRKADGGTWILSGNNSYTGVTEVRDGVLKLNHDNALSGTSAVTISGGDLDLNGRVATIATGAELTFGGGTVSRFIDSAGGGLFTLQGDVTYLAGAGGSNAGSEISANISLGTARRDFWVNDGDDEVDLVVSGVISGGTDVGLRKRASGILRLTGDNTYSGQTHVMLGVLQITSLANEGVNSSLGTGADTAVIVLGNGTSTGTLEYVGAGSSTDRQIQVGATNAETATGGAVILSSGTGPLRFTNSQFVAQANTLAMSRTLTIGGENTGQNEIEGVISNHSAQSGRELVLRKEGGGTWILSGANTFAGGTTVSGGILEVNNLTGSGTGTGSVIVENAGSTLAGTGLISGEVSLDGGTILSPGQGADGIGRIGVGGLNAAATSTLRFDLGGVTTQDVTGVASYLSDPGAFTVPSEWTDYQVGSTFHDQIFVSGDAPELDTLTRIEISPIFQAGLVPAFGQVFQLLSWSTIESTAISNTPDFDLPDLSVSHGLQWDTGLFQSHGVVMLVPEPGRAVLVLIGLCSMVLRRRRPF